MVDDALNLLPAVLGFAALAIGLVTTLPQLLRILRGGSVTGVSLPALANGAISALAWTVYSLWCADGWLLLASVATVPGAVATAWTAWRLGWRPRDLYLPALWLAVLALTAAGEYLGFWQAVAVVVGGSITWLVVPAVVEAWRSRDVHALSPGMWWLLVLEALVAVGYGHLQGLVAPIVYGLIELAGAAAVLARVWVGHLPPPPVPDAPFVLPPPLLPVAARSASIPRPRGIPVYLG